MSSEDNNARTRIFFDRINRKDLAVIDELYTPDFVLHDPAGPGGWHKDGINNREEYKQYMSGLLASLPGQFTTDDMIAEGDKVVTRWTYRSTHKGQWRDVAGAGKEVTFTGTSTSRIVDDKTAETWQNVDNLGVLTQLGLYTSWRLRGQESEAFPGISAERNVLTWGVGNAVIRCTLLATLNIDATPDPDRGPPLGTIVRFGNGPTCDS